MSKSDDKLDLYFSKYIYVCDDNGVFEKKISDDHGGLVQFSKYALIHRPKLHALPRMRSRTSIGGGGGLPRYNSILKLSRTNK